MAQMIKNPKILAIIPARGGSKGIPKKNIKFLLGKPLINYTIESAQKSRYLDKIVVSTEDREIHQVVEIAGIQVIKRPKELSEDDSSTYSVIEHAINFLQENENYKPDIVLLLQPTSPLRSSKDIDSAIELFLKNKCESVVGVCEFGHPVHTSFQIQNNYLKPIFGKKYLGKRRQDLPIFYVPNGAIFISTPKNLFKYKSFYCKKVLPYIMPIEKSIDIDNDINFKLAELLIQEN